MKASAIIDNTAQEAVGETEADLLIPLTSLSQMTGFPVDFIKSELFLEGEKLSMDELRSSMASYLERTHQDLK